MHRFFFVMSAFFLAVNSPAQVASPSAIPPAKVEAPATTAPAPVKQEEALELLKAKKDLVVLDVRMDEEFKAGHLEGAKQIDFLNENFIKQAEALDKTKPYLVYCAMGGRSKRAAAKMRELGFTHVYDLAGGFNEWLKAKKPLTNLR